MITLPSFTPPPSTFDWDRMMDAGTCLAWMGMPVTPNGERWLKDQARAGKIPAQKLGAFYRFHPRAVYEHTHNLTKP